MAAAAATATTAPAAAKAGKKGAEDAPSTAARFGRLKGSLSCGLAGKGSLH